MTIIDLCFTYFSHSFLSECVFIYFTMAHVRRFFVQKEASAQERVNPNLRLVIVFCLMQLNCMGLWMTAFSNELVQWRTKSLSMLSHQNKLKLGSGIIVVITCLIKSKAKHMRPQQVYYLMN